MKPENVFIRPFRKKDWQAVQHIYQQGLDTGQASFQQRAKPWEAWDGEMMEAPRLVAEKDGQVIAWTALSPVSSRCVYAGVAEVSIYVGLDNRGQGVGGKLLKSLIAESEAAGIWTLQAGIFPENTASLALHKKCGFRIVGVREKLGELNGIWRDVLLLERRSSVVGN